MTETTNTQKVESGLSKKTVLLYKLQNPVKFQSKFGHLNLDLITDENQKFNGVKDMEAFINYTQAQLDGEKAEATHSGLNPLRKDTEVQTPNVGIPQSDENQVDSVVTTNESSVKDSEIINTNGQQA